MWAGQSISMFGDRCYGIGLAWLALTLSGSPLTLATVVLAATLPRAGLILFGGTAGDRVSPRTLMLLSNLARGLLCALLVVLLLLRWMRLWHLYAISAAFGAADAFFLPSAGAIVPRLVSDLQLTRANALMGVSEQLSETGGPAIGGLLVAGLGPIGAFVLDGLSFVAAILGLLPVPSLQPDRSASKGGVWRGLGEGLTYVWKHRQLRAMMLLISFDALTYNGIFAVGIPTLARFRFGQGAVGLGILGAAWGTGQLLGAVSAVITGLPRRWGLLVVGVSYGQAVAFAALGLAPTLWMAALVLATLGFAVAYSSDVAEPTIIQQASRPELLGRVHGVINQPRHALGPVSLLAFGALATRGATPAFLACALGMLVGSTLAVRLVRDGRHGE
jgi:MFS family permease